MCAIFNVPHFILCAHEVCYLLFPVQWCYQMVYHLSHSARPGDASERFGSLPVHTRYIWICDMFESVTRLSLWHRNTVSVGPAHTLCQLTLVTLGVHIQLLCNSTKYYHTVGNFQGRNLREFRGFVAIWESFLPEIWGLSILWQHKWAIHKSFLCKIVFSSNWLKVFTIQYCFLVIILSITLAIILRSRAGTNFHRL